MIKSIMEKEIKSIWFKVQKAKMVERNEVQLTINYNSYE